MTSKDRIMPTTVPRKSQQRSDVGDGGQHGEVLLEIGHFVNRRVLHGLLDLVARLAVLQQPGLDDRGNRSAVLFAHAHGALDVPLEQGTAHLGDELGEVQFHLAKGQQL